MHFLASHFQSVYDKELKHDPHCERKVKYRSFECRQSYSDERRKQCRQRGYNDDYANRNDRYRIDRDHQQRRRYGTPPSENKFKLINRNQYDYRDQRDQSKSKKVKKYSSFTSMSYYDLAYVLNSDYLNVKNESTVISAAYRYWIKVINQE